MSQSPETSELSDEDDAYLAAFGELAQRIRNGASFSGRERHCAFLNTGTGRFADISAVSGFALPEDGRGMALTDWDHDGDLDVWMSNRTAPRLRFFQNQIPPGETTWISFQLQGDPARNCPRDAVGSRVELVLESGSGKRIKTLQAGHGLMSQSSKWLHFGLDSGSTITAARVYWAGGAPEDFPSPAPGRRWVLRQGSGSAEPVAARPPVNLPARPLDLPAPTEVARIRLSQPLQTPSLTYQDFEGGSHDLSTLTDRGAVLVNLWATWCVPCVAELKAFAAAREQLAQENLTVLALNVDHLDPDHDAGPQEARTALQRLGFTLPAGMASPELVDILNQSILKSVYRHRNMPVPVSFLIDQGGWLSAIYKGPVELEQVLSDRRALGKSRESALAASIPFEGTWAERYLQANPVTLSAANLEGGYVEEARSLLEAYLAKNTAPPGNPADPTAHARNMQLSGVHAQLAEVAIRERNGKAARDSYRQSLAYNPKQVPVLNSLAWLLATSSHPDVRNGEEALRHAQFMMQAPGIANNPSLLATLAAAQAASGRFEDARSTTQRVISLYEQRQMEPQAAVHRNRLLQFEKNEPLSVDLQD